MGSGRERAAVVTSWPVLVSLVVLLINDWYLKAAWGNWFTGKLSDFAGILLVSLLLFGWFPRYRAAGALSVCAAFTLWKSPLAAPLIDGLNALSPWAIGRVVDYSDLMSLVMVPVAWGLLRTRGGCPPSQRTIRRIAAVPAAGVCLFAMVATTLMPRTEEFEVHPKGGGADFERQDVVRALQSVAEAYSYPCEECENLAVRGRYGERGDGFHYVFIDDSLIRVEVHSRQTGVILPDGSRRRNRKLSKALVRAIEEEVSDVMMRKVSRRSVNGPQVAGISGRAIADVFEMVEKDFGVTSEELSDFRYRGIHYRFEDGYTLAYSAWSPERAQAEEMQAAVERALRARFTGLRFYQFGRNETHYVDLREAKPVATAGHLE